MHLFKVYHATVITRVHAGVTLTQIKTYSGEYQTWDIQVLQCELSAYVLRVVIVVQNIYCFG